MVTCNDMIPRLACVFALIGLAACTAGQKLDESAVDAQKKALAQSIAQGIYSSCVSGEYKPLTAESIPEMRAALSPENQRAVCETTQRSFGAYESMDYAETWKAQGMFVYRFKGHFSKSSDPLEIRVVLDGSGTLTGFWLKPWSDALR